MADDRDVCHYPGVIRRLALAVGLSVLVVLGFGAAYGLSSALNGESLLRALQGHTPVVICHHPGLPTEHTIVVDDSSVLKAHLRHGDHLGPCGDVITVTQTSATTTLTIPTVTSVPITETDPPTTVTEPPQTSSTEITPTVPVPPDTTTVPGESTIVTVPPTSTETVTLPGQTVTQPPVTTTIPGGTTTTPGQTVTVPPQVIERPTETVTLPGATTTIVAAGTTTVVTVTGPNQIVHPGLIVKPVIKAKIKQARRLIRIAARTHRENAKVRFLLVKVFAVAQRVIVVASGCTPGTALSNGTCRPVVRGKG
jgi:hypothetical protein